MLLLWLHSHDGTQPVKQSAIQNQNLGYAECAWRLL